MLLTREKSRAIDRYAIDTLGFHPLVLMENAGRGAARLLPTLGVKDPVLVVCGKGNNGGDGLVVARHLLLQEIDCQVLMTCDADELSNDARASYDLLANAPFDPQKWNSEQQMFQQLADDCDTIVDAMLGTGAQGDPRSPYAELIRLINDAGKRVVALDVPSGLDCDTGRPATPTIRADATITFVASKVGFQAKKAHRYTGQIYVTDIGVPIEWLPSDT